MPPADDLSTINLVMSLLPENLIFVRAAVNLPGFRFGEYRYVNGDDPYIIEMLNSHPPLLVLVLGDDGDAGES